MKGEFMPSKKETLAFLAGAALMIALGYFELYVMGYDHSMQIGDPFVQATPFLSILTSWYSSLLALGLLALGAGVIGDWVKRKETPKDEN
jgi:CDP-diglyceride synthetase